LSTFLFLKKEKRTCVSEDIGCVPELDSALCELVDVYVLFVISDPRNTPKAKYSPNPTDIVDTT
jgi:hypothetical protein